MLAYITGSVNEDLLCRIEYLLEENRVLRNQLQKRILLTDHERRTLAERAIALGKLMADTVTIVKPETILKWHRRLVAQKFDGSRFRKRHGRPPTKADLEDLVVRLARENPAWGYDPIAGAILNLGHRISDQTVGNILLRKGLGASPERRRNTTWASFIRQHRDVLWATDFFTTEIWTRWGLTTYYVLFFIHVQSRRIVLGGMSQNPNEAWMKQIARNVTSSDGPLVGARYLIHDRDAKYTQSFDQILKAAGTAVVRLPPQSPNLNAFAERFVKTIKTECLEQFVLFGENSLRHVIREYLAHYHAERNHQGIENVIPFPDRRLEAREGTIPKAERLGGLLNFYHRRSANCIAITAARVSSHRPRGHGRPCQIKTAPCASHQSPWPSSHDVLSLSVEVR
jgi:transposase InsO family protein